MKKIKKVIIHCSDSHWGNAALITGWHIHKGWSNIGYHYVILNGRLSHQSQNPAMDGHLETGRPMDNDNYVEDWEIGAHALGHNSDSLGICLIGKKNFTPAQLQALKELLLKLRQYHRNIEIIGHYEVDLHGKTCPNFNVQKWLVKEGINK